MGAAKDRLADHLLLKLLSHETCALVDHRVTKLQPKWDQWVMLCRCTTHRNLRCWRVILILLQVARVLQALRSQMASSRKSGFCPDHSRTPSHSIHDLDCCASYFGTLHSNMSWFYRWCTLRTPILCCMFVARGVFFALPDATSVL